MPVNCTSAFLKSALTVVLAGGFCGLVLSPSACAQEEWRAITRCAQAQARAAADAKSPKVEAQIRVKSNIGDSAGDGD